MLAIIWLAFVLALSAGGFGLLGRAQLAALVPLPPLIVAMALHLRNLRRQHVTGTGTMAARA